MTVTAFQFNWLDVASSPDRLSQATMAELAIRVGDSFVTSVLDRRARSHRDHVFVPLLHVAEWLVTNWWHIWHEIEDLGSHPQRTGFESRHDLAYAGNGFVLPKLTIVPLGNRMHLRWSRWRPAHAPIEFLDEHNTYVDRVELEAQFRSLIDAVLERLRDQECPVEPLEREWQTINSLDSYELEFCQAAALLGLDPFSVPDDLAQSIIALWNRVAPSLREDALAGASADSLSSVGQWIDRSLHSLASATSGDGWREILASIPAFDATRPWERGFALGRFVRARMSIGDGRFEFETSGRWRLHYSETDTPFERIQGIVAPDDPSCLIGHKSQAGTRFLLARALGDYLGRLERGAGMLSSLATPRQAQSRSFAAEFLAPSQLLRQRLGPERPMVDEETVDELAGEFGVSNYVVRHQIKNHKLGTIVETT